MAEVFGFETGVNIPSLASSTIGFYILIGLSVLVLLGITALVLWWYFNKRLYRFSLVVFENISGQGWQVAMKDRAKYLRLSKDGTEVLWLKKKKIPLTAYGKKMGPNQYWFAIGQDGGWYNIVLGDLDAKKAILDIEPIDRDIKYVSVAMRRNATENYGPKITWMDKYGTWIMGGVTLIIFFAGLYFILEQIGGLVQELVKSSAIIQESLKVTTEALAHVDSILSGGSGIITA